MENWEYFIVQIDANVPSVQAYFSQLGAQGWELVGLAGLTNATHQSGLNNISSQTNSFMAIFKRRKPV